MRGWRALHAADVVLADRLADPDLTGELRPGVATDPDAGKSPGAQQLSQDEINEVLIEHAAAGLRVARLKGGDPFVFGRGGEEAAACAAAGIPCSVIPGLSSATAGPPWPASRRRTARSASRSPWYPGTCRPITRPAGSTGPRSRPARTPWSC